MTGDIVERLRKEGRDAMGLACGIYCLEAADEIERLRARLDDGPAVTDLVQELRVEVERLKRRVLDLEKYPRDLT